MLYNVVLAMWGENKWCSKLLRGCDFRGGESWWPWPRSCARERGWVQAGSGSGFAICKGIKLQEVSISKVHLIHWAEDNNVCLLYFTSGKCKAHTEPNKVMELKWWVFCCSDDVLNVFRQNPLDGWKGTCGGGPNSCCHGDGGYLCAESETCCSCPLKGGPAFF